MTKQDTIHDEELFSAKSMLNYFKYLHKNNKLEICEKYLSNTTKSELHTHLSHLYDMLHLAINSKEHALINSMKQLVPNLENYISHKNLKIIEQSCYLEEHARHLNLLGASPEE
jgi:hypothetical protein